MYTVLAYDFRSVNDEETEISIYDVISNKKSQHFTGTGYEAGSEVTPNDFKEQLNKCKTKNITIRMNSSGGEVNAANVIAVAIEDAKKDGKHFTCKIDGICASAAVQIATVCDEVVIHKSALMMIHNPAVFLFGTYDVRALKSPENLLEATKNGIISYYEDKTGLSKQKLSNMMDEETYMTGEEAVQKGFADALMFEEEEEEEQILNNIKSVVNCNKSLNIPQEYMTAINNIQTPTKGEQDEMDIKTVEDLVKAFPALTNELTAGAVTNATADIVKNAKEEERARLQAIDELQGKVSNDLLNKAKYETMDTAQNVAMEAIKTGAFVQSGVLDALEGDAKDTNGIKGLDGEGAGAPTDEKKVAKDKASQIAKNYLQKLGKVVD